VPSRQRTVSQAAFGRLSAGYVQSLPRQQRSQLDALRRWAEAIAPEIEFNLEN
jgi:hypothetical protein